MEAKITATTEELQEAINNGEVLTVIYHGGSQPGIPRQLAPMQLLPDGKLRARCIATNTAKIFVVSKIEVVNSADAVPVTYSVVTPVEPSSLGEAIEGPLADVLQKLRQHGWDIQKSENHVSVHRIGKNGKPLKKSALILEYRVSSNIALEWSMEAGSVVVMNNFPHERPWKVSGDGIMPVTYGNLAKAVERFIQRTDLLD